MDKLYEAAKYYSENLEGRRFYLTAGKKGKSLNFVVFFGAEHFKHLVGLQKLKDIPAVQRKSDIVYKQILDKKTTYSDIESSSCLYEMKDNVGRISVIQSL